MDEYISREVIVKEIKEEIKACDVKFVEDIQIKKGLKIALRDIKAAKTADVQPVKRGEWKYYKNTGIFDIHKCSVCATPFELPMDIVPSSVFCFCPHCGARMDGDTE